MTIMLPKKYLFSIKFLFILIANAEHHCSKKATGPVCGLDSNVHPNACLLVNSVKGNKPTHWVSCTCTEPHKEGEQCPDDDHPVCGSDGKMYKNQCLLLTASCKKWGVIFETDDHTGNCTAHECSKIASEPTCAYTCSGPMDCEIGNLNSKRKHHIMANPCIVGMNRHLRIRPFTFCDCDFNIACHTSHSEVCGNDKRIYKNRCELMHTSCKHQDRKLREIPLECCESSNTENCS